MVVYAADFAERQDGVPSGFERRLELVGYRTGCGNHDRGGPVQLGQDIQRDRRHRTWNHEDNGNANPSRYRVRSDEDNRTIFLGAGLARGVQHGTDRRRKFSPVESEASNFLARHIDGIAFGRLVPAYGAVAPIAVLHDLAGTAITARRGTRDLLGTTAQPRQIGCRNRPIVLEPKGPF